MAEEYKSYKFEPRGPGGELVAVLIRINPKIDNDRKLNRFKQTWEDAFNETSLARCVANLEKQGLDVTVSRAALDGLRVAKRSAPSNG